MNTNQRCSRKWGQLSCSVVYASVAVQAATAETAGWRDSYETEAKTVLYELQHLIHENGQLEVLQNEGNSVVCDASFLASFLSVQYLTSRRLLPPSHELVNC